eukprot:m.309923 g.309923  ORF g.309923 m.309923 type:complete len:558 (+) comp48586_c0_seq1:217-1890(+)
MAQQPRKFVEKMALLKEKERQQSMAVEQVLREVRDAKVGVGGGRRVGNTVQYGTDYAVAAQPYYNAHQFDQLSGYGADYGLAQQQQLLQSRLSQSLPVLYSPPHQQQQHNVLDLQGALHEQREMVHGGSGVAAATVAAPIPGAGTRRFPLRKAQSIDCRPEPVYAPAPPVQPQTLDVPSEQLCRRIKSEPDIHNSVKSLEDSAQLRRQLLAPVPIPEDDRDGLMNAPLMTCRQRTQSTILPPSYGNDGYHSLAGARASSVPDLLEAPLGSPSNYDEVYGGHLGGAASAAAAGGQTAYLRRQGVMVGNPNAMSKARKSPVVSVRGGRRHHQHPFYGEPENVHSPSMPPPMYTISDQQQHQENYSSDFPALVSPPISLNSTSPLNRQHVQQQAQTQPQGQLQYGYPQLSDQHSQLQQMYFCDVGADVQQQTAALQQKFNAMNMASSIGNDSHVTNSSPFQMSTSSIGSLQSDPSQLMHSSSLTSYAYPASSLPALVVTPNDQRMSPYSSAGHTVTASASETLVDSLFAEQLDNSDLKTLLYSENMLPDPETEEALKRQP